MTTSASKPVRAFGALADLMKDHVYALGGGGIVFTSPWVVTPATARFYATILLSARGAPFRLSLAGTTDNYEVVALKQMTKRALRATNARLLSFQLDPSHRHFPSFRTIAAPGLRRLQRSLFASLDAEFEAAYRGELTVAQASQLFDKVMEKVLPQLPPAKSPDARVRRVIDLLWKDHDYPLQELALAVGLSYDRLSHLFVESMGLSLRMYQHWRKVHRAMTLISPDHKLRLTDIAHASGFTDSSHMCRAFIHTHGAPPSHFLNSDYVKIFSSGHKEQGRTMPNDVLDETRGGVRTPQPNPRG